MRKDRLRFEAFDKSAAITLSQGDHCVLLQLQGAEDNRSGRMYAGIVLTDDEAHALGLSLLRRARYSRREPAL